MQEDGIHVQALLDFQIAGSSEMPEHKASIWYSVVMITQRFGHFPFESTGLNIHKRLVMSYGSKWAMMGTWVRMRK